MIAKPANIPIILNAFFISLTPLSLKLNHTHL